MSTPMSRSPSISSARSVQSDAWSREPPPTYAEAINAITDDGRINFDLSRIPADLVRARFPSQPQPGPCADTAEPREGQERIVPRLNIVMQVVGSRGDVQPFVALGQTLKGQGHRVRIATHPVFRSFVQEHDLEFFSIGGDPSELMAYMVKNPGLLPKMRSVHKGEIGFQRQMMRDMLRGCWRSCIHANDQLNDCPTRGSSSEKTHDHNVNEPFIADAIIANPPSFAHIHCAEKLGIPLHILFTMPWTPTSAFEHPLTNIQRHNSQSDKSTANILSYYFVDALTWQGLGDVVNRFRYKILGLEPLNPMRVPGLAQTLRIPHTYTWSPALIPKPSDWLEEVAVTGFAFLNPKTGFDPPKRILQFLESGPPPIFIGFGSIVVQDYERLRDIVVEVVQRLNVRAIISNGWAGLGQDQARHADILFIDDCPHDWLFQHVACVVHHGGAGTTAAGLVAGRPTVIVPFFGDQLFWGRMVNQVGAGPPPLPWKFLDSNCLERAISAALEPPVAARARDIAGLISQENGLIEAAKHFNANLPLTRMQCSLEHDRVAVWRTRKHGTQLSSLSATVLIEEGRLKANDLELHHSCKYDLLQGPWEPMSGAVYAVMELFYDTFKGCGEILADVTMLPQNTVRMVKQAHKADAKGLSSTPIEDESGRPKSPNSETATKKVPGKMFANGCIRILKASARAPGEFTLAMAKGAHNAPLLWGDRMVRQQPKVDGISSGLYAGVSELFIHTYDGITGLVTQPITDMRATGPVGLATGLAKGVVGMPVRFWSGMNSVVGYPLKGVDKSVTKLFREDSSRFIRSAQFEQGVREASAASVDLKHRIILNWDRTLEAN